MAATRAAAGAGGAGRAASAGGDPGSVSGEGGVRLAVERGVLGLLTCASVRESGSVAERRRERSWWRAGGVAAMSGPSLRLEEWPVAPQRCRV
jgi:hypothetical protein